MRNGRSSIRVGGILLLSNSASEQLNAIYEEDFLGFSYGFRPRRGAHDALDAPAVAISKRKVK